MNRTLKLLMFSDIFVLTGFGLIEPVLAIFIKEDMVGGTIFAAGLSSTLFLLTKCIVQLPFSRYVDSHPSKIKWLILGTFLVGTVPFIYIFAEDITFVYIAQIVYGLGSGLAYPTWLGLWSTHLDRSHESFEWSLYSTMLGVGTAVAALVGAAIAEFVSFTYTFALVGIMALTGCFVLFGLEHKEYVSKISIRHYHRRRKLFHFAHHGRHH